MGVDAEMLVTSRHVLTDERVREVSYGLVARFGVHPFWMCRENDQHALVRASIDDLEEYEVPRDETALHVNLAGRYWGPGYARGHLHTYIGIADYLERVIPDARVYYGGDTGARLMLFDREKRDEYLAHFASESGMSYRRAGDGPPCEFCGGARMVSCVWGGDRDCVGYKCRACDLYILVYPDGSTKEKVGGLPDER